MARYKSLIAAFVMLACGLVSGGVIAAQEQANQVPLLADDGSILLTVFLKHDQSMNNAERREVLDSSGFSDMFPPDGVEIVNHYVMMGIGQVVVLRLPPSHVRRVNRAIEYGAWGSFETEFYLTYDLRAARAAEAAAER